MFSDLHRHVWTLFWFYDKQDYGEDKQVQHFLSQDLGADERCDRIHGGRDECHKLLCVLSMGFTAILCQPMGVGLESSK